MQPVNIEFPPAKAGWQQSEEKGEAVTKKLGAQRWHQTKIDTCARNVSTDQEEPGWDVAIILQLQDTVEAASRKNAQYLQRGENARKHYGRRNYDRAHMRQMQKTDRKDLVHN